jgi:Mrp family chromosome partitioning ATPase
MTTQQQAPARQQTARSQRDTEAADAQLQQRMSAIGQKLLVLSGKGGVGKSTIAVNLAAALARRGHRTGLLDVDVHGPSVPHLLRVGNAEVLVQEGRLLPVPVSSTLMMMSIGFLLTHNTDAIIWRGPRKYGAIRQFLQDVDWGRLDYLVIDCPPGTGDEPLAVAQLVGKPAAAIIVTTPQQLAISDVRRCVTFCRSVSLPIRGIVENMSGFVCPHCGKQTDLFKSGGGASLAKEMGVPFLGAIPIDPRIVDSGEIGRPFVSDGGASGALDAFERIVQQVVRSEP